MMFPIRFFIQFLFVSILAVCSPCSAGATVTMDGALFPLEYQAGDVALKLRGVATLRHLVFIKAYTGGLYLPETLPSEDVLSDDPKRLVLEYFHSIEAEDFADATRGMVEKNTDADAFIRMAPTLDRLCNAYRSVTPKDRYALTYAPETGLELSLNGELLGTFEGAAFARAVFSVWIGEKPIDQKFKKGVLGL